MVICNVTMMSMRKSVRLWMAYLRLAFGADWGANRACRKAIQRWLPVGPDGKSIRKTWFKVDFKLDPFKKIIIIPRLLLKE
jgi:hypothetical protein